MLPLQKDYFYATIFSLHEQLKVLKTENTLQEFERFENQITLNELEKCILNSSDEELDAKLIECLSRRWERIRNSGMCYTQKPFNSVNQLCLEVAKAISPRITTKSEIEALKPNTGPYCILMPSLERTEDIAGGNIHELGLHEFVLSDRERGFIPLTMCLHDAHESDMGRLRQMVMIDGGYPDLTPSEITRVCAHSSEANAFYKAISTYNRQRLSSDDIGSILQQLVIALRAGGIQGSGEELDAAPPAIKGTLAFNEYWTSLNENQRTEILAETPELRDIIGRLFRPKNADYRNTRYCVHLIANDLEPIIARYNNIPSMEILKQRVLARRGLYNCIEK